MVYFSMAHAQLYSGVLFTTIIYYLQGACLNRSFSMSHSPVSDLVQYTIEAIGGYRDCNRCPSQ